MRADRSGPGDLAGRVGVIAHPAAGRGRVGRHLDEVLAALGPADPLVLSAATAADVVAKAHDAIHADVAGLVAVGGDGTAHLALQAVAGTGVPLGLVPLGTGNDLADAVGVPAGPIEAAQAVLADLSAVRTTPIDAVRVSGAAPHGAAPHCAAPHGAGSGGAGSGGAGSGGAGSGGAGSGGAGSGGAGSGGAGSGGDHWYAAILSVGFDSAVNARANRMRWPRGPRRYDVAILAELARLRTYALTLDLDGVRVETPALLAAIGNTRSYGGGMRMCPDADPTDGLLDVTVVGPVTRRELIRVKPRLYDGTHVTHPAVRTYRAATIRVDAPEASVFADGEPRPAPPLTLTVVPGALHLLGAQLPG